MNTTSLRNRMNASFQFARTTSRSAASHMLRRGDQLAATWTNRGRRPASLLLIAGAVSFFAGSVLTYTVLPRASSHRTWQAQSEAMLESIRQSDIQAQQTRIASGKIAPHAAEEPLPTARRKVAAANHVPSPRPVAQTRTSMNSPGNPYFWRESQTPNARGGYQTSFSIQQDLLRRQQEAEYAARAATRDYNSQTAGYLGALGVGQ